MSNIPRPPRGGAGGPTPSSRQSSRAHTRNAGGAAHNASHLTNPGMTTAIGTRPSEPSVSKVAIEAGAERVFMTHPRMFSFSHRSLQSLRHPFLAFAVIQVEADLAKVKRQWQTRAERLSDTLTEGTSSIRHEDARWAIIGRMLDGVLCRDYIAERRQLALENVVLRRSLENWWCKVGGTTTKGVSEVAYRQVHQALYTAILQTNDSCLQSVINKAVEADWQHDSEGRGEVPFGRWYISLLEIADTWVARCDGESYGQYLDALLKDVFPSVPKPMGSPGSNPLANNNNITTVNTTFMPPSITMSSPSGVHNPPAATTSGGGLVSMTPSGGLQIAGRHPNEIDGGGGGGGSDGEWDGAGAFGAAEDAAWLSIVDSLRETAATMENPPLVRAKRNVRGIVEYEKAL